MINLTRVNAIIKARFREFYRDTASWSWNLIMPFLVLLGFSIIFSGDEEKLYKVALINHNPAEEPAFLKTRHIQFIQAEGKESALLKVQRHQLDMLLDLKEPAKYWINENSSRGYITEKILISSLTNPSTRFQKEIVRGKNIRYVDWLMPGILSMNMMFSCLWGIGWVVVRYRKNGVLRRLQATPLTAFEFLFAQIVARMIIITVVTIIVFIGVDSILDITMHGSYAALFLVFFSGAFCFTCIGLLMAVRLKTEEVAKGLLDLVSWPMMILSGVWFSLEGAHPAAQWISQIFPLTHLVSAARKIMIDGAQLTDVISEILILCGLTFVLLLLSAKLFRWN